MKRHCEIPSLAEIDLPARYLAEFATGNDRKEAAENSLVAYKVQPETKHFTRSYHFTVLQSNVTSEISLMPSPRLTFYKVYLQAAHV